MNVYQDISGFETLQSISKAKAFNEWMYHTIHPFLKGNILELGSGIGNISDYLIRDFSNVSLSDYNLDYCATLKAKYHLNRNLKAILSIDLQDPDFRKNNAHLKESFDSIILLNVIEHLQDDEHCIDYCHFLLKEGGNLIVLAPAYSFLYSKFDKEIGHYRRYTTQSLSGLIQKSFKILHKQYFNFLGMAGWLFFNKMLGRRKLSQSNMATFDKLVPVAKLLDNLVSNRTGVSTIVIGERK